MDRASSLVRRNVAFAAVGGAAALVLLLRPAPGVPVTVLFPKAFPGFETAKARAIVVERKVKKAEGDAKDAKDAADSKETLRVVQTGADQWVVETAFKYPARIASVKRFLDGIASAEVVNEPTSNAEKFAEFAGPDGFTEVRVLGDGEASLLTFGVGRGNAEGVWSNHYLRLDPAGAAGLAAAPGPKGGGARIVTAKASEVGDVRTDVSSWIETRIWPSTFTEADVQEIAVDQRSKSRTISLFRGKRGDRDTEDPWTMSQPEEGKGIPDKVKNLVNAAVGLSLTKVIDSTSGPEGDAKYGFDKPDLVVTARGRAPPKATDPTPEWTVTIGKKSDVKDQDGWFARRARNGTADPFVLLIADYSLGDFRNEPSAFVEPKAPPAPPTPPAPPPGPGMDAPPPAMGETAPGMGAEPAMGAGGGAPPTPPAKPPTPPPAPPTPPPAPAGMGDGGMK